MGRTQRKREKRNALEVSINVDNELQLINLRKWLKSKGWNNENQLMLRNFSTTGRGVTSNKNLRENDVVIAMPYELMITYRTVETTLTTLLSAGIKLKIHDLLTLFLITEKGNENSLWKDYINSLPAESPPLPWLATSEELNLYPSDLQIISRKNRENFQESLGRIRSICTRCNRVITENEYEWGFVLVNTRAVYVDPYIDGVESWDFCQDEPSMALCPFLDMFNHHFVANTESGLVFDDNKLIYKLRSLTGCNKHQQIFISYGPHDNVKLVMEYGFFIPGNVYDVAKFCFQEVLKVLKLEIGERQYKFVMKHKFDNVEDLYVGYGGVSFNLKAVLFIAFADGSNRPHSVIFSDRYPEEFLKILDVQVEMLLDFKLEVYKNDYERLHGCNFQKSTHALLIQSFLKYRIDFLKELKTKILRRY